MKRNRQQISSQSISDLSSTTQSTTSTGVIDEIKNLHNTTYRLKYAPIFYGFNNPKWIDGWSYPNEEDIYNKKPFQINENETVYCWNHISDKTLKSPIECQIITKRLYSIGDEIYGGCIPQYYVKNDKNCEWVDEALLTQNKDHIDQYKRLTDIIRKESRSNPQIKKYSSMKALNALLHPVAGEAPRRYLMFRTPPSIISKIIQDRDARKREEIIQLPHRYPITKIFNKFETDMKTVDFSINCLIRDKCVISKKNWKPDETEAFHPGSVSDSIKFNEELWEISKKFLINFFNLALPRWLLSEVERPQWLMLQSHLEPHMVYGIEHFLRFLLYFPKMILSICDGSFMIISYIQISVEVLFYWLQIKGQKFYSKSSVKPPLWYIKSIKNSKNYYF
eukprot:GHVL01039391.1.p1 GENE.GHVL01039391.1~~GHVL01039391.1.p1  ORF type:complete len:393 (-),score=93.90 GHVL01039391.1:1198-2376(-)